LDDGDFEEDVDYLQNPLNSNVANLNIEDLKKKLSNIYTSDGQLWEVLSEELIMFQETLEGSSFDFGFRVINEILIYSGCMEI